MKYSEKEKQAIIRFLSQNRPFHHGNCDPSDKDLGRADHHDHLSDIASKLVAERK